MRDLSEAIQNNYVLALEVTNGLKRGNFGYKVDEALKGKRHLQNLAPNATVNSGVIFTRNEGAITNRRFDLEFLLQLKHFKQTESLQALEQAIQRFHQLCQTKFGMDHYDPQFEQMATYFMHAIRHGTPLDKLFYPTKEEVRKIAEDAPIKLPHDPEEFSSKISDVKGITVEEYMSIIIAQLLPQAQLIRGYEFTKKQKTQDIDCIIIGDEITIRNTLIGGKTFYAHRTIQKQKERQSGRNYSAMFR